MTAGPSSIALSIVIPCFNEARNIPVILTAFSRRITASEGIELILVDNGSTDDTQQVIQNELTRSDRTWIRSIRVASNVGYGHGIMQGVRAAHGATIAWTHADLQASPDDVLDAYKGFVQAGAAVPIVLKGRRRGRAALDAAFTFGMSLAVSAVLGHRLTDVNAQPKMFHRSFLGHLPDPPDDFALDLYFLLQASTHHHRILEHPVVFGKRLHGKAKGGGSLAGKWRLTVRTFAYIMRLKRRLES